MRDPRPAFRQRPAAALIGALLALGGCGSPPAPSLTAADAGATRPAAATTNVAPANAAPAPANLAAAPPAPAPSQTASAPTPAAAPVAAPMRTVEPMPAKPRLALPVLPDPKPQSLVGMTRADVAALLGPPTLMRREIPAEVWQYTGPRCVLHVFLYREGRPADFKVRHVELRTREARRLDDDPSCFRDFIPGLT